MNELFALFPPSALRDVCDIDPEDTAVAPSSVNPDILSLRNKERRVHRLRDTLDVRGEGGAGGRSDRLMRW